jgi:hypothetical protein
VARVRFNWNGSLLRSRMRIAQKNGVELTGDAIVKNAQGRARVDSGDLKGDIAVQQGEAFSNGHGFSAEVGSMNLAYGMIQEVGPADGRAYSYTPYMVPAMDEEAPKMAEKIAKEFGNG